MGETYEIPMKTTYSEAAKLTPTEIRNTRLRGGEYVEQGAALRREFVALLETALACDTEKTKLAQLASFHPRAASAFQMAKHGSEPAAIAARHDVSTRTAQRWLAYARDYCGVHEKALPEDLEAMPEEARFNVLRYYRPNWFMAYLLQGRRWHREQIANLYGVHVSTVSDWLSGARNVVGDERTPTLRRLLHRYYPNPVLEENEK